MSVAGANDYGYETEYVTDGNLALKRLEQRSKAVEEAYKVDLRIVTQPKPKAKAKVNAGNLILLVLMIFAFVMGVLYMQTTIQQNNLKINTLKNELAAIQKETAELKLQVVMSEDIGDIRTTAIKDFGMVSPGEGQIIKITVDKGSMATSAAVGGN